jgi:hypothetical protein
MKILALISVKGGVFPEQLKSELPAELNGSWQLYLAGVIREVYLTQTPTRVVFVLEANDLSDARQRLGSLPLVAKGLFEVDLHELRPFANWAMLPRP